MQTGIFLDYVRDDVTAAALRLAGSLQRRSIQVDFLTGRTQQPVHGLWDHQVLFKRQYATTRGNSCLPSAWSSWPKRNSECIWFRYDIGMFKQAVAASPCRRHVLVPKWHDLRQEDFGWLGVHHMIVCSSPTMARAVKSAMRIRKVNCPVDFIYWSSGVQSIEKSGYRIAGQPKLVVVADRFTLQHHCDSILLTLGLVLRQARSLSVTLVIESGWPKHARSTVKRLLQEFSGRLAVKRGLTMDQRVLEINKHDWLWMASVRGTTGFPLQEALSCGVPVIVWDIAPFNELILNGWNGWCVPVEHTKSELKAPTATWSSKAASTVLCKAFRSEDELISLQEQDWLLDGQEADFREFWERLV